MTTIISFIAVLGLLIFIHELGHFGVAKLSGVGVEKFSLGFGPKLIGIKRGETEYRISMLPLGGYVKMIGEAPGEEVAPSAARKSFANKPVLTRASIVAAGPVMNLVLAALLLPVIFMIGIDAPAYLDKPAVVGYVAPEGAAYKAGVKKDDVIKEINDSEIKDWEALLSTLAMNPGKSIGIEVFRGGHEVKLTLTPDTSRDTGGGYAGMYPPMRPVIFEVAEKYPAKEAGLKAGDTILAVNGKEITHWAELEGIIHKDGSKKKFLIDRGGENFTAEITPVLNKDMNVYLIGISRKVDTVFKRYGFFGAVKKGASTAVEMTGRLFLVIKGLILGQYSFKTLGGPIMIAQVAGRAAAAGVVDLLSLVAFLSLQLGIINLFPIPVLDGGHILFLGIESLKGHPLSDRFMGISQQIGIALLIALMVLVTYNDIFRLIG